MSESNIKLDKIYVNKIKGTFYIADYQRGYRWGEKEVKILLNDIYYSKEKTYCLQPVVVKKVDDKYELIDGQQRMTTIYLIYKVMNELSNGFIDSPKFTIEYENRNKSKEFLQELDINRKDEYIDFNYIFKAYETIKKWFNDKDDRTIAIKNFISYLDEKTQVIWYEVENSENSIEIFERLNIGKIQLTSSELIKAKFLCGSNEIAKREEKALIWDNIEKELQRDKFWYFLTNGDIYKNSTHIDLLLDILVNNTDSKDTYYSFFAIEKMIEEQGYEKIWDKLINVYNTLKDFYENHEYYHKIGYLVYTNDKTLSEIYNKYIIKNKSEFKAYLKESIANSINIDDENYGTYLYSNESEKKKIQKLLILFNVISVENLGNEADWFPFERFKNIKGNNSKWSLEHIHAQNPDDVADNSQEMWKEWLQLHKEILLKNKDNKEIVIKIEKAINSELDKISFLNLASEVMKKFTNEESDKETIHNISNLALLLTNDNSALKNSAFDVKRNSIIRMEKEGAFIPYSTKMAFLKYYTPSEDINQIHYWGNVDKENYVKAINSILKRNEYLKNEIIIGE